MNTAGKVILSAEFVNWNNMKKYLLKNWFYCIAIILMIASFYSLIDSKTNDFYKESHVGTLVAKDKGVQSTGKYNHETSYTFAYELEDKTYVVRNHTLYEYTKFNVGDKFKIELPTKQGLPLVYILTIMLSFIGMTFYSFYNEDRD